MLGRPTVAAAGKLNILVAGSGDAVETALPVLDILGVRVWRLGERPRVANVVKVAVNYNIIHAIQALGESVAMTERHGVEPAMFHELLTSTLFDGVVYRGYGAEIVNQTYRPARLRDGARLQGSAAGRGGRRRTRRRAAHGAGDASRL